MTWSPRTERTFGMRLNQPDPAGRRFRWPHAVALVASGAIVGGIAAASLTAGAATTTPSSPSSSSSSSGSTAGNGPAGRANDHGSAPVRSDEKAVSASTAATLKAAALKAVPGGTVYRIETDSGDAAYEAHMTKADGTEVTVKFDKNLNVTAVETGMGKGDPMKGGPGGAGGPHGPGGPRGPEGAFGYGRPAGPPPNAEAPTQG
jgi:hypothetical protein